MKTITDTDYCLLVFPNCLSGYQIVDVAVEDFINFVRAFCDDNVYVEERGNNLIIPLKTSTQLPKINGQVFFVEDLRCSIFHLTGRKITLNNSFFQDVGAILSGAYADLVIALILNPYGLYPAEYYKTKRSSNIGNNTI